jgi:hypothetical protein
MAYKVEVECYYCGNTFDVKNKCLPMQDEGGYNTVAVCPTCSTNCGEVSVMLTINEHLTTAST